MRDRDWKAPQTIMHHCSCRWRVPKPPLLSNAQDCTGTRKVFSCLLPGCLSTGVAATHSDQNLQCQARDSSESDQKIKDPWRHSHICAWSIWIAIYEYSLQSKPLINATFFVGLFLSFWVFLSSTSSQIFNSRWFSQSRGVQGSLFSVNHVNIDA